MQARVTSVGLLPATDPSSRFEYPAHINRDSLDSLPSKPGVYIFRDEQDRPLYIGKSINLRSRVLAHLRTVEEARMLAQSRYVEHHRTAGDIGALLLESRLIKDLQPLYNKKLRRTREMCTLRVAGAEDSTPEIAYARDLDFARTEGLYGLFATRRAALEKLRELVDGAELCPALTGIESVMHGRPCFARQLSRCRGACIGKETAREHARRLRAALESLRVVAWPYESAMGIVEECDGWRQVHIIDHWFYLGSVDRGGKLPSLTRKARQTFDVDTYKILVRPMLEGTLAVEPVQLRRPRSARKS